MRVSVLASGSSGNCALIEARGATVFVDAGIPPRVARMRIRSLHRSMPHRVDGVIVTHSHGDHARHAQAIQRSFHTTLFVTPATAEAWSLIDLPKVVVYEADRPFTIDGLVVTPTSVPHDVPQVSLRLDDGEHVIGLATDLGVVPQGLVSHLSGCSILLIEANHDPEMLANGPYPPVLKQRIASEMGHLSNEQTAELLKALPPGFRQVVLMHLSEKNNDPAIAIKTIRRALKGRGVRIHVAKQREPLYVESPPSTQLELGIS